MTIDTTRAPEGVKPAATTASRSPASATRSAAAGAPGSAGAGGGFAGLMGLLSASDAQAEPTDGSLAASDAALVFADTLENNIKNRALALDGQGLIAIELIVPNVLPTGLPLVASTVPTDAATLLAGASEPLAVAAAATPAGAPESDAKARSAAAAAEVATLLERRQAPTGQSAQSAQSASQALSESGASGSAPAAANTDVASLLEHRRASQSQANVQTQLELRQASLQSTSQPALAAVDTSRAALTLLNADALPVSADRRESRPGSGQLRTGLEGALGGSVADRLGINPTYEVAAASAVVAEGQVAETVSYWASQGIQSAELTLDGLGDEPVEVRISVEGDQAQIDFRSNQPEVRQALEAASAQLKALLSGEGLQLSGMSVGTSSRGASQGEGGQPKPSARQAKLVSLESVRASSARAANPAVGQALDLYV